MLVRINDIKEGGLLLDTTEAPKDFPLLREMIDTGDLAVVAPVHARLRVYRVQEMIEVEGEVDTVLRFSCSGCLNEFEAPAATSFAVTYVRELPAVTDESGDEVEVSAEEMGMIPFEGEEIDLRSVIEEQIVMTIPIRPMCRRNCKGLCPVCGADRNETECGCVRPVVNNKFSALKDFRVDDKNK